MKDLICDVLTWLFVTLPRWVDDRWWASQGDYVKVPLKGWPRDE